MKPRSYYCDTWAMQYYFLVGWNYKKIEKFLNNIYKIKIDLSKDDGFCIEINGDIYIWTRHKHNYPVIAHECTHAATMTLNMRGWQMDYNNDEPLAYLIQTIMEKILR